MSNQQLAGLKKGIKREVTSHPTLKDERYFDSFSSSLYITAKSHYCNEVLDPDYTPSPENKESFENKQAFMFSVFNTHLLTDMGTATVKKHVHNTDAQGVWKDIQEHIKSSLKGVSEKTVLDDNFKGTAEQLVLHFSAQFQQPDDISETSELFSPTVKLILLPIL